MDELGKITYPKNGAQINNNIQIQVEIYDFLPNLHFWLALQWSSEITVLWIKKPEITTKYWRKDLNFGVPAGDFSFVLLSVSAEGQCFIENWYRFGELTQSYPGLLLDDIPTGKLVHAVDRLGLIK